MKIKSNKVFPTFNIECSFLENGHEVIAGFDEAGRGALAGPLTVAGVIFPKKIIENPNDDIKLIIESKSISKKNREYLFKIVKNYAAFYSFINISPGKIDEININRATELAINEIIEKMPLKPDISLIDGNFKFNLKSKYESIKKGDLISKTIAAASIIAKVSRDNYMTNISNNYNEYNFKKNAGYGTFEHRKAIEIFGPSDLHRKSYEPVKSILLNEKD